MHRLLAPALAVALPACSLDEFGVREGIPEQLVRGGPQADPLDVQFKAPVKFELPALVAARETGRFSDVTLSRLALDITRTSESDGDDDDWGFVERIEVYLDSDHDESLFVAGSDQPGAVRHIAFTPVEGVDLLGYVDEGATVIVHVQGTAPPDDISFEGEVVFRVDPL